MAVPIEIAGDALVAGAASAVYATVFYLRRKAQDKKRGDTPRSFNWNKFGATVALGTILGAVSGATGNPVTQDVVANQLAAYGAYVVLVEQIIKGVRDEFGGL